MPIKPDTEEYWQANSDARTLTEAEAIKTNDTRLTNALEVLTQQEEARKAAVKAANSAQKKLS